MNTFIFPFMGSVVSLLSFYKDHFNIKYLEEWYETLILLVMGSIASLLFYKDCFGI